MVVVIIILLWLLVGLALGLYEARRGHWRWLWLLGAIAGPLAIPIARQIEQNERLARPLDLRASTGQGPGTVRLLAGIDGSEDAVDAARQAADLLGSRLGEFELALVTDFDVHEATPGPLTADDRSVADERRALEDAAERLAGWLGFEPATVILSGVPARALRRHAVDGDFDVIAVGSRGRGLAKRLLGSCASGLAQESETPTLIMPSSDRVVDGPSSARASSAREE